jgi:small ligand-binding sensory domain FIST
LQLRVVDTCHSIAVPSRGAHTYVAKLQEARQRSVIVGGFASGYGSDDIALFLLNDNRDLKFVRRSGIVGLSIGGAIDLNGMSARGCKSLTPVYKVTQGSKSTITELEKYDPENPTKLVPANLLLDVYDQDESMQVRIGAQSDTLIVTFLTCNSKLKTSVIHLGTRNHYKLRHVLVYRF